MAVIRLEKGFGIVGNSSGMVQSRKSVIWMRRVIRKTDRNLLGGSFLKP